MINQSIDCRWKNNRYFASRRRHVHLVVVRLAGVGARNGRRVVASRTSAVATAAAVVLVEMSDVPELGRRSAVTRRRRRGAAAGDTGRHLDGGVVMSTLQLVQLIDARQLVPRSTRPRRSDAYVDKPRNRRPGYRPHAAADDVRRRPERRQRVATRHRDVDLGRGRHLVRLMLLTCTRWVVVHVMMMMVGLLLLWLMIRHRSRLQSDASTVGRRWLNRQLPRRR